MEQIRILIADSHKLVAQALSRMLAAEPGLAVAERLAARHRPEVALRSLGLPRLSGVEATRRICSRVPTTRVIIGAESEEERHVLAAVRAGAYG